MTETLNLFLSKLFLNQRLTNIRLPPPNLPSHSFPQKENMPSDLAWRSIVVGPFVTVMKLLGQRSGDVGPSARVTKPLTEATEDQLNTVNGL